MRLPGMGGTGAKRIGIEDVVRAGYLTVGPIETLRISGGVHSGGDSPRPSTAMINTYGWVTETVIIEGGARFIPPPTADRFSYGGNIAMGVQVVDATTLRIARAAWDSQLSLSFGLGARPGVMHNKGVATDDTLLMPRFPNVRVDASVRVEGPNAARVQTFFGLTNDGHNSCIGDHRGLRVNESRALLDSRVFDGAPAADAYLKVGFPVIAREITVEVDSAGLGWRAAPADPGVRWRQRGPPDHRPDQGGTAAADARRRACKRRRGGCGGLVPDPAIPRRQRRRHFGRGGDACGVARRRHVLGTRLHVDGANQADPPIFVAIGRGVAQALLRHGNGTSPFTPPGRRAWPVP